MNNCKFWILGLLLAARRVIIQGKRESKLLATHSLPDGVTVNDAQGCDNGARFLDLNGDGYDDLVISNAKSYGVYLFVPKEKEKKNLQWFEGWSQGAA